MAFWGRLTGPRAPNLFSGRLGRSPFTSTIAVRASHTDEKLPKQPNLEVNRPPHKIFKELGVSSETHHLVVLRHFSTFETAQQLNIAIPIELGVTFHDQDIDKGLEPMILTLYGKEHFLASITRKMELSIPVKRDRPRFKGDQDHPELYGLDYCYSMLWFYLSHLRIPVRWRGKKTNMPMIRWYRPECTKQWTLDTIAAPDKHGVIKRQEAADFDAKSRPPSGYNVAKKVCLDNGIIMRVSFHSPAYERRFDVNDTFRKSRALKYVKSRPWLPHRDSVCKKKKKKQEEKRG
ncbi:hypothetical protein QBC44DRAFT_391260 [Cladorrhinum sp. PSN332]|nr:hypothetical protein QBC44DRAFT_391260 [Cladorrhinum sp. PSN332]